MTTIASQITSLTVVNSTVYSDVDQRKHQSSASLAFVWGIHRDRWIPRTKGQLRGKWFHLMTSSWWRHDMVRVSVLLFLCRESDGQYNDVIISAMASQITSLMIVFSTIYLGADQRKHQSSESLAFVRGIHRWPEMFPFDDVIMDIKKGQQCGSFIFPWF